ncbi:hypothetical protein VPNG_08453 [Cytospora leucostoma]|uniref:Uncharacterized protein n=1 Tax=Cytospora leucostoma TaxID=1230097 RepID=A0A423WRB0_9PEZI|nr:hypothetical protein VPNG_08453 [Cytospora leucostoma]
MVEESWIQEWRAKQNDWTMLELSSQRNDMTRTQKPKKVTNPAKVLWWETYQLWDEVLYQVGKAYYKAKPPEKLHSRARPGSTPMLRSERKSLEHRDREGRATEARNMQLVRQRSYSPDS